MPPDDERRPRATSGVPDNHLAEGVDFIVRPDCPVWRAALRLRSLDVELAVVRLHPLARCAVARRPGPLRFEDIDLEDW